MKVQTSDGTSVFVDACAPSNTVADVKASLQDEVGVPPEYMRLFYREKELTEDARTLGDYATELVGAEDGDSDMRVVYSLDGGADNTCCICFINCHGGGCGCCPLRHAALCCTDDYEAEGDRKAICNIL